MPVFARLGVAPCACLGVLHEAQLQCTACPSRPPEGSSPRRSHGAPSRTCTPPCNLHASRPRQAPSKVDPCQNPRTGSLTLSDASSWCRATVRTRSATRQRWAGPRAAGSPTGRPGAAGRILWDLPWDLPPDPLWDMLRDPLWEPRGVLYHASPVRAGSPGRPARAGCPGSVPGR